eukprot:TRINITY_DN20709_c0_g1_i1.p1 TRINITY_DN20709_c0_g1~~TRINITY_DN20709_c0_g1_i1.p1  ORF type:complete len:531 (+),score=90.16 TRINITY_DN20709_c0_g1_i1:67-1593(+)
MLSALVAAATAASRPNVLFILADDWGWGDVGAYGANDPYTYSGTMVQTPFLDSFAKEGTLFTDFHTGQSFCAPSRTTFMFGRFPADLHVNTNWDVGIDGWKTNPPRGLPYHNPLPKDDPNVASMLQDAGYATAHFGKWHLGGVNPPNETTPKPSEYGFDLTGTYAGPVEANHSLIDSKNLLALDAQTDPWWNSDVDNFTVTQGIEFMTKAVRDDKPFYVNLWFHMSHDVVDPRPEWFETLYPFNKTCLFPARMAGETVCPAQIFWGAQSFTDGRFKQVVDAVDNLGVKENTLIVFSTDNGAQSRTWTSGKGGVMDNAIGTQGPFRGCKGSLYDGGHRVPFIARWPGKVPANRVDHSLIGAVDWLPTILKIANVPLSEERRGYDISDILFGTKNNVLKREKPLMWRGGGGPPPCWNRSPGLSIRQDDIKILINPDGTRLEVYNMSIYNLGVNGAFFEAQNIASEVPSSYIASQTKTVFDWHHSIGPEEPGATDKSMSRFGCTGYKFPGL